MKALGLGCMKQKPCFCLGQYTTVFQTKAYTVENLDRGCRKRNICDLSDS
jgi:hypothetical protein